MVQLTGESCSGNYRTAARSVRLSCIRNCIHQKSRVTRKRVHSAMQRRQLESKPEPRSVFHGAMDRREGQLARAAGSGAISSFLFLFFSSQRPHVLWGTCSSPTTRAKGWPEEGGGDARRGCWSVGARSPPRGSLGVPVAAERPRPRLPATAPQAARSPRRPLLPPAPSALISNLFISLSSMFRGLSPLPSTREHVYRATVRRGQSPLSHAGLPTSAAGSWPRHCRVPDGLSPWQTQSCPPRPPSAPEVLSVPLFAGKGTARTSLGVLP